MAGRDGNLRVGSTRGVSRRGFLQSAAGGAAGLALSRWAAPESALAAPPPFNPNANPITRENRLSPSGSWTGDFRFGTGKYQPDVTGFATKTSVNAGESLPIKLNVYGHGGATTVDLQIFRLGYYGGAGGRLIATLPGIPVTDQGFLPVTDALGYTTAAVEWNPTVTINTTGYETGMYLIKIVANPADFPGLGNENHIPFIVRADGRARDLLVVMPTNTWQAYNAWGGKSVYVYNSSANPTVIGAKAGNPNQRAAKVSFDRPMTNVIAEYNWVLRTEFPLIWWLERQGYNLTYTDDLGVHSQPAQLRPPLTKTVAIAGHSEYWTKEMRDNMEAARDAGANIASFSANTAYWQVRLEDAGRSLVCFKTVQSRDVNPPDGGTDGVNDFGPGNIDRPVAAGDPLGADHAQGGTGANGGQSGPGHHHLPRRGRRAGRHGRAGQLPVGAYPGGRDYEGLGRAGPNRPENALFGVMYIGDDDNVSYPLEVPAGPGSNGEFGAHPAWRHTTIAGNGGDIGNNLVGWEWDAIPKGGFYAAFAGRQPAGVKRLAETVPTATMGSDLAYLNDAGLTYSGAPGGQGPEIQAVTYRAPSGAQVFSAGTMQWSWGLGPHFEAFQSVTYETPPIDSYSALNGVIQQATHNILYDGGVVPATAEGVVFDSQPAPPPPVPPATGPPVVTPRDTEGPKVRVRGGRKRLNSAARVRVRVSSAGSETTRPPAS